jgi:hypothetical protein
MAYIGQTPSAVPLDGSDIADDIVDSQHYAAGSIDTAHLADDQITLAKMAAGTDGNIISYDASGNPVAIATGSDGQVLTSAGAGAPPAFEAAAAGGLVVQVVTTQTGAVASNTGTIPHDDTIPTSSEGAWFMELAITPTSASNRLIIIMHAKLGSSSALNERILCVFQDSGSAALAVQSSRQNSQNSASNDISLLHSMIAGTASATTFKMRAGCGAGTTTFNGNSGSREFGGAGASSITIMEVTV